MNAVDEREPAGIKDIEGRIVCLGDIVEIKICGDHGIGATCAVPPTVDFVRRRDMKSPIPGHSISYLYNVLEGALGAGGGMFAHKADGKCRVIGKLPEDAHMVLNALPDFARPVGEAYRQAVEDLKNLQLVDVAP